MKAQQVHLVAQGVRDLIGRVSLTMQERKITKERLLAEAKTGLQEVDKERAELQQREQELREERERVFRVY